MVTEKLNKLFISLFQHTGAAWTTTWSITSRWTTTRTRCTYSMCGTNAHSTAKICDSASARTASILNYACNETCLRLARISRYHHMWQAVASPHLQVGKSLFYISTNIVGYSQFELINVITITLFPKKCILLPLKYPTVLSIVSQKIHIKQLCN